MFVDRSLNANNDELLNLARKLIGKNDSSVTINNYKEDKDAGETVNKLLEKYLTSMKQPYLVILQA